MRVSIIAKLLEIARNCHFVALVILILSFGEVLRCQEQVENTEPKNIGASQIVVSKNPKVIITDTLDPEIGLRYLTIKINGKYVPNPDIEVYEGMSEQEPAKFEYAEYSYDKRMEKIGKREYLLLSVRGTLYSGSYSAEEWTHIIDVSSGKLAAQILTFFGEKGSATEAMYFIGKIVAKGNHFKVYRWWMPYGICGSWMGPFAFGKSTLAPLRNGDLKEKNINKYCIIPTIRGGFPDLSEDLEYKVNSLFFKELLSAMEVFSDNPAVSYYLFEFTKEDIHCNFSDREYERIARIQKFVKNHLKVKTTNKNVNN